MHTGHSLWTGYMVVLLITCGESAAPGDLPPRPDPSDRLTCILEEWQRRSAACMSVDVRFTAKEDTQTASFKSGGSKTYTGRIALGPRGKALVSFVEPQAKNVASETERLIWTNDVFHHFQPKLKVHVVSPIAPKERGRLPAAIALPFLWNTSVEAMKRCYQVELIKEDAKTVILAFTPTSGQSSPSFSKAYLELERATYLPQRYRMVNSDGKGSKDFRVMEAMCNQPMPEELFQVRDNKGLRLVETVEGDTKSWLSRFFKKELLP